ncbi:hypothetical protein [Bacillus sp. Marseille-P3661]|uniref:hypothetical protein n=1 Tax=Bacillus sp. Marseille-P3661 TaxID=1936234 RepID=UPI000C81A23F|nr:hypothetical protein [Bacillus sp. Marseille-P3661]
MPTSKSLQDAFKKEEFKGLVIDTYISNKYEVARHYADKVFTIGYKKIRNDGSNTNKFATLAVIRGVAMLILHLGKREEKLGIEMQIDVDHI